MGSKSHFTISRANGRTRRFNCLNCWQRIFYGDRCPGCQRDLRQRQLERRKRKPR